jgi:ribose-phosphate pyrophosphokinase
VSQISVFTCNANRVLASKVAKLLGVRLGDAEIGSFSDGETMVEIRENVRGKHVFIIQSTSMPTNDNLMELILLSDALRRASVASITAVVPYFGYARQDRRVRSARVSISAKVVADMISSVGISRIITVDLHADQIQGFFTMPVDNVYASSVFLDDLATSFPGNSEDFLVVSPDVGGVVRARAVAKRLNGIDLAIIDKRRSGKNQVEVMHVIGNPEDKICILVDDIIDTGNTLCQAALRLKESGAKKIVAYCTHPVLSGSALDNINASVLDALVVTDTITLNDEASACQKIRQLSMDQILAKTIIRVSRQESVSSMFLENEEK